jgi:hypothetical protein
MLLQVITTYTPFGRYFDIPTVSQALLISSTASKYSKAAIFEIST